MAYAQIFQRLLQRFFLTQGRAPMTPNEWSKLRRKAMELSRKEGGDPITGLKIQAQPNLPFDTTKDLPTTGVLGKSADIIPFRRPSGQKFQKMSGGVENLLKTGQARFGKALKTTPEHLKAKKDRHILLRDADEARAEMRRKNKQAVEDFKRKFLNNEPKTVEDLRDKGDWDPGGMAQGGIAPLVGEPSYAANFYDDRTPMEEGGPTPEKFWTDKMYNEYRKYLDEYEQYKKHYEKDQRRRSRIEEVAQGGRIGLAGGGGIIKYLKKFLKKKPKEDVIKPFEFPEVGPQSDFFQKLLDDMLKSKSRLKDFEPPKDRKPHEAGGRIGLAGGGALFKFIEKLFIKASNDIRLGRGKWKGLDQKQRMVQHDNLTKKVTEFQKTGNTEGLEVYFGVNPNEAFAAAKTKVKKVDFSKYTDKDLNALVDEDIKLLAEANKLSEAGTNYGRVTEIEARRKEIREILKAAQDIPPSGYDNFKADLALQKQAEKKVKKTGSLVSDDVLAKAYDEVFYQKPVSGDYKYDADVLSDSIAEQLGKESIDDFPQVQQTEIYNTALKRVQQDLQINRAKKIAEKNLTDLEQKIELQMFNPKDRLPNQSGGPVDQEALIQMYLEEGLSYDEAVQAAQATSGLDMDISKKAEGGRADFIFGGSAGLRALLKRLRPKGQKRVFPSPPQGIKKFMGKSDKDYIDSLKLQQLETILKAAKIDKETLAHQAMVKKMNDPGLNFLMGKLDEAGLKAKNLDKYTNVDKDIMDIEMMIKNYTEKKLKRKPNAEGGITRAGFPFGGKALKAIRAAWRANKDWGVGGPPYNLDATSFDVKKMTKKHLGTELSLNDLRKLEKSPFRGPKDKNIGFDEFNQMFKNIKAQILREKMMEKKLEAKAMIHSADMVPANTEIEKKVQAQFTRDGKKQLEEAKEGLKEMDIYMGMLQKKGRKLHAEGGRVSYSGGGRAGLPAITYGTPQMNMQGPQMPAGPQPAGIPGGTIVAQNQMQQSPWMGPQMPQGMGGMPGPQPQGQPRMPFGLGGMFGKRIEWDNLNKTQKKWLRDNQHLHNFPIPKAEGGRIGFGLGGFNAARRAFLKKLAGFTGAGVAAGTGLLKFGKAAKVVPKVTETAEVITRGADGMPSYIYDLIEVVKSKGTKDIVEGFKKSDYSTVHSYKGVDVIEDPVGNIKIKSDRGGVATDPSTGKTHEGIAQEHHMQIERGQMGVKDEGLETQKSFQEPDEYIEGTVRPDMDGKMKDFEEGLDKDVHEFFKKIADEIDDGYMTGYTKIKPGKASGGLAYALGE